MKTKGYPNIKRMMADGEELVRCSEWRYFDRFTSGRSFRIETGEFFAGRCGIGVLTFHSSYKFADRLRICKCFNVIINN